LAFWQRAVDAYVGALVVAEFTQVRGKWWHVLRLLATAGSEPIAR
jgi:hypothetical protein